MDQETADRFLALERETKSLRFLLEAVSAQVQEHNRSWKTLTEGLRLWRENGHEAIGSVVVLQKVLEYQHDQMQRAMAVIPEEIEPSIADLERRVSERMGQLERHAEHIAQQLAYIIQQDEKRLIYSARYAHKMNHQQPAPPERKGFPTNE